MKKIFKSLIILSFIVLLSGCLKTEELDNATIYTTTYPIEYIVKELYGYNSEVLSIYPEGANIDEYKLSNKKIKKYSKSDLFVYNGSTDEKRIAADFVNKNSRLKIIDVSEGLVFTYNYKELWLNPINYLMIAQNVKNGLKENIESAIIKEEIDTNYQNLKSKIVEFETSLETLSKEAKDNTIVVSKNYMKFLESYGFNVISIEETDELSNDTINKVINLIKNKEIKYVFVTDEEEAKETYTDTINKIKEAGAELKVINTMTNLTTNQKNNNEDYNSLMRENIEMLKEEIYS